MAKTLASNSPATAAAAKKKLRYKRVLFKVSGEALMGGQSFGIDPATTARIAKEIAGAVKLGAQIAVVVGGGNIFRGVALAVNGANRVTGDQMGMLATVINAMAMKMALQDAGVEAVILSAIAMPEFCQTFSQRALDKHLNAGAVVVFAAGTGNPYFTTDTGAALRACEMQADAIIKGTQVDGVYSADPKKHSKAERYTRISHSQMLEKGLAVMDLSAVSLARDAAIPIIVFALHQKGELLKILQGGGRCTIVAD